MIQLILSHPYGGDRANLDKARALLARLNLGLAPHASVIARLNLGLAPHASVIAPWIDLCYEWPETEETRAIGMAVTEEAIRRSDGLVVVLYDDDLSPGQRREVDMARRARRQIWFVEGDDRFDRDVGVLLQEVSK